MIIADYPSMIRLLKFKWMGMEGHLINPSNSATLLVSHPKLDANIESISPSSFLKKPLALVVHGFPLAALSKFSLILPTCDFI
jgi:hypothetical protein